MAGPAVLAQSADSLKYEAKQETEVVADTGHSVAKATWLSTALPGAGQMYNGKYWKLPIIYGGIGTCVYFAIENQREYRRYLDAFLSRLDSNTVGTDEFTNLYNERQLIELQNIYRDWRDLSLIIGGLVWALNVIDAHVDAHLYYYNVDENISMRVEPNLFYVNRFPAVGFRMQINLTP